MINIILRSFRMHKKKFSLIIIQFVVAFLSLLLSLCMLESLFIYKHRVESVMNLNTLQVTVPDDEDVEENEDTSDVEPEESKTIEYNQAMQELKKSNPDVRMGMIYEIGMNDISEKDSSVIMVNNDFIEMSDIKMKSGSTKELLNYKTGDKYVPVIISSSMKDDYAINKTYKTCYYDEGNEKAVVLKVVGITADDTYMFMGNCTSMTETIIKDNDYIIVPQIMNFSEEAFEYNMLLDNEDSLDVVESMYSKNIEYTTLKDQVNRHYSKQKMIIVATMVFSAIIIIMSLLGCIGTILSNIAVRKKEFGIYYSMGLSKRRLLYMVMGEGIIMFLISFVIALAIGLIAINILLSGEDFAVTFKSVGIVIVVMLICIVLCEWMPLKKIDNMEPIDLINERAGK